MGFNDYDQDKRNGENVLNLSKRKISIIIAIVCTIVIVVFLLTNIIRFTDLSSSIAAILVAGMIGSLVWGFKPKKFNEKSITSEKQEHGINNTNKSSTKIEKQSLKILHKSVKLRVDGWNEEKLNLKRGIKITGKISSEGFFNVYFLTESSYRSFKNENNFHYLDGADEVSYFEVNFEVPRRDDYYFVIQNEDKKNIVANVELYSN